MKIVSEGPQYVVREYSWGGPDTGRIIEVIRQHGFKCVREYMWLMAENRWVVHYRG